MIWIICFCALLFSGCQQQSQERHYTEIAAEEPPADSHAMHAGVDADDPHAGMDMSAMSMPMQTKSAASNAFTWTLPKGWEQEPGQGFRLASFHLSAKPKAVDGSIVNLAGVAGGLEGNLRRWMGQIGMQTSNEDLTRLINNATPFKIKSGQEGKLFDFTTVQEQGKPADKSMIVIMVELPDSTLFIKMTGTIATVGQNKAAFLKLAGSVAPNTDAPREKQAAMPSMDMPQTADPHAGMNMADPHAGMDMGTMGSDTSMPKQAILDWVIPQGWKQIGGHPMRLGTFQLERSPKAFDCSVILLGGEAGGVDSNLTRWIGQIGIKPTPDNLKKLIAKAQNFKTKDGMEVAIYDLTLLQGAASPQAKSMMVGMLPVDGSTIFVKITGTIDILQQQRESFTAFVRSLKRK